MLQSMQAPMFFGLIAAFVTSIGLLAVALRADWSERYSGLFALAAAGMLVTMTLLHIAPEAFEMTARAPIFILSGFLGGLMLSFVIRAIFPDKQVEIGSPAEAVTPIIAIAIHSFIDGVIYSVTFAGSFASGVYAALALILHEFPEGVIAFAILRRNGVSNRGSFIFAFLAAAATTPLGVAASAPFMYGLGADTIGALFAVSAGLLLYVATGPLMAPLKDEKPGHSFISLSAGVGVALLIAVSPLTAHDHHGHGAHEDHESHDATALDVNLDPHAGHDHEDHEDHDH